MKAKRAKPRKPDHLTLGAEKRAEEAEDERDRLQDERDAHRRCHHDKIIECERLRGMLEDAGQKLNSVEKLLTWIDDYRPVGSVSAAHCREMLAKIRSPRDDG